MGHMDWDWGFGGPTDYIYGSPDYPDVHREWVRRESVSGTQGLVNQHGSSGRMAVPRLFDYGGLNHCQLLPDVAGQVCDFTRYRADVPVGETATYLPPAPVIVTPATVSVAPASTSPPSTTLHKVLVAGMGLALVGILVAMVMK